MDSATAHDIARVLHSGQRTADGRRLIDHVERVAAAVPSEAQAVAFLHDALERTATTSAELSLQGCTPDELGAVLLLTRSADQSYGLHVLQIAYAPGEAGRLARIVKAADLEDHLEEGGRPPSAPPYRWAYRHITIAREWWGEAPPLPAVAAAV
jgi:hypothetical protein